MAKTFWLSFVGDKGNLGCAIIDVTDEEASAEKMSLDSLFPQHMEGAEWIAAALTKAHLLGCNPGGEVASWDITDGPSDRIARYEKNRLYSKREIEMIEREPEGTVIKELREWDAKDPLH